ncbi:TRAP transporter substrate-binding protein DctP [Chrysiogenes arsenatis]|uniref:TRAP transporter substrate-binding protein DctP n=1 Tax=Chrysiogenes arsenatis TaxID=309797 RepID=UPI0004252C0C|nr:TRAP transporter substrate-binding protein DctP [Chrysiogenes arsenatis]
MKKNVLITCLAVFSVVCIFSTNVLAMNLRMLSAFHPNFIFNIGATNNMIKNLEEMSGGKVKISFHGPDVVSTFEQLQPVQSGIFDLSFTHATYHAGSISIGVGMDATIADPEKRREVGLFDLLDKEYNKIGIKLVSLPVVAPYHFVTRQPLSGKTPSLAGLKMRSNPSLQNTIIALGGTPVTMAGGEVYTSLQRGVIDGAAWTQVGVKDFKWNEVAKYLVSPNFGSISMMIIMNLKKYDSLTPEQKSWIDEAGKKTELDSLAFFNNLIEEEIAYLLGEGGMTLTHLSPEDVANVEKYWNDGLWEMGKQSSNAQAVDAMRKLAVDSGMTR